MKSVFINGVKTFVANSRNELIEYAFNHKKILVAVNAEKIYHATNKSREIINRNLGYSDGIGAVWALNKKGFDNAVKIPGCELWLNIVEKYYQSKTFYLVGGKQSIIEGTVKLLKEKYIGINIVNYRNGYLNSEDDEQALFSDILDKKPDVVFVAMGSPKQELLMEKMQAKHQALYQGLGGSFDVFTGNVDRAPNWWLKNNLEWAYRLFKQPSRIRRQIHLIMFIIKLHSNKY